MVNVVSSYKLLTTEIDGKEKTIKVNTSDAWNVFEFVFDGKKGVVSEGDDISFVTENAELKKGQIVKISGKKEKTKIQILPEACEYEEIWSVTSIKDGTLQVIGGTVEDYESDEDEDENDVEDDE
jgi:hypothetical protein